MNNTAVVAAVLSVMALLFLTTVLSVVTRKVRLPFSITLVLVGIGLAELIRLDPSLAPLARLQLSPALLTYIFLPTLIFETAFAVDSRLLSKNMLPVLVLAIPGVALSAAAAALGFQWALGLPIVVALLLGALVTSTDSTAVTAIFRDLGAPKRLHILAQGENLFNDAASVLLFQLLLAALGLAGAAVLYRADGLLTSATISFLLTFVGGLLVGAASGYVIGKLIEIIEDDELVEILLTTVLAYLAFLVADRVFQVSGIMAVVGAALTLGGWGRTKFSPGTLQYVERFWAYLAFVASSLVFLLVGLAIDLRSIPNLIGPIAWTVFFSITARGLSIYGLFPLVNRLPGVEDADLRHQTAMVWGGFRGPLSLVLAMSLPESFAHRELFLGVSFGLVLFSLLVQGLTLEPMIRLLGLHRTTLPEQYVRDESLLTAKHRARERITELRRRGIFNPRAVGELEQSYAAEEQQIRKNIQTLRERGLLGSREELRYLKREYLLVEKRSYLDLFHRGQLSENVLKDLQHSIELQLDYLRAGGVLPPWTLHSPLRWKLENAIFRMLDALVPGSRIVQQWRLHRIADRYEEHWGRLVATERVLDQLREIQEAGRGSADLVIELRSLYARWHDNARKRLDAIAEQFPEYATKVQQLMAAKLCLQAEEEVIDELERLEVLPDREAKALRDEVRRKLHRLRKKPLEELRPRPRELLAKVPFFRGLPPEEFDRIVDLLRPRTFLADETILKEGDVGNSLFLIGRGVVRVTIGGGGVPEVDIATLLAGDFFGEMAVLSGNPRNATVTAVSHCLVYELRRADLEEVAAVCPTIQTVLEATYRERSAIFDPSFPAD